MKKYEFQLILKLFIIVAIGWAFQFCNFPKQKSYTKQVNAKDTFSKSAKKIGKEYIPKQSVTGDFDADGSLDTLNEHVFSLKQNLELDSFPSYEDYYEMYHWLDENEVKVFVSFQNRRRDTLFASGLGLFSLINVGDINKNGGDEIAVTIQYADFSNLNTCRIYTYCKNSWKEVLSIGINESAFWYDENENDAENNIPGFLEKINGKWKYYDYSLNDYELPDSSTIQKIKPLTIKDHCH